MPMPRKTPSIDPAILRLLALSTSTCTLKPLSGGMSSASKFHLYTSSPCPNAPSSYFIKTARGPPAAEMLRGEHASLTAVHAVVNTLCPRSFGWGELEDAPGGAFLVTEFLDLAAGSAGSTGAGAGAMSLARKLAKLHSTAAPAVAFCGHASGGGGGGKPMFGFPVPTCCGDTAQRNAWKGTWAEFFAEERLGFILERCEKAHGQGEELRDLVQQTATKVVPRLLGRGHLGGENGIQPVVVHGDLWSGNVAVGRIGDAVEVEEVVFDPSACYAHSEFELGIMHMFGGFGEAFWRDYHALCPKTEPVEEYEDRRDLYQSYHYLNHYALFGGGYRSSAVDILKRLLEKYDLG